MFHISIIAVAIGFALAPGSEARAAGIEGVRISCHATLIKR
jgi:hypothetical protein